MDKHLYLLPRGEDSNLMAHKGLSTQKRVLSIRFQKASCLNCVNSWAESTFNGWVAFRSDTDDPVPSDLLSSNDPEEINKWLCKFVLEVRQQSGQPYPPKSLHSILCGLLRLYREKGGSFNFLDKKDARFTDLHKTLDTVCSTLHAEGIGASTTPAPIISIDDEELLLNTGVMSMESPTSLQFMVFFYIGIHCCLRGGQEQRDLSFKNFTRSPLDVTQYNKDTYYVYTEFISKNNLHRYKDIHSKNKTVKIYSDVGSRKCVVQLLDFYFSKLPPDPKAFYVRPLSNIPDGEKRPLSNIPDGEKPWYANVPVGINTLRNMLKRMSEKAGLSTIYTNHSLRATSASRLFSSNVPEKLIQEKTGHRSLAGLRAYERTSSQQLKTMSKVLNSAAPFSVSDDNDESEEIDEKAQKSHEAKKTLSTLISGNLDNCTINLYTSLK